MIDDSIDWRKRYFTSILESASPTVPNAGNCYPHAHAGLSNLFHSVYSPSTFLKAGQSFQENLSGNIASAAYGSIVFYLDSTSSPALPAGAILALFVRQSDGALCVYRNNVDAARRILAVVSASGRFANVDANGL